MGMTSCGNSTPKPNLKTDVDTLSYAMGLSQTQGLKEYLVQMDIDTTYIDAFVKGLNEGANAGDDKKKAAYFAGVNIGQQISNRMVKGINHEIFGEDSTKMLPSGLQYKVIKEGNGAMPKDTSLVTVNYEGRTIDGKVFDSSYKRNQPAEMRVNQVIKGFTEALVHMPAGSVWEVYIPQNLAYGEREAGEIKPFSTLIFKIELLKVK